MFTDPRIPADTAQAVRGLAAKGRLPQSVLLTGGPARLREACGDELAAAALCLSPVDGCPCGKCAGCVKVRAGTHPDLIRILPAKDKKSVSRDTVKDLVLDRLYVAPNEAENKVFLVPDADDLSPLIQNALLKSIEEPPPFVCFIFLSAGRGGLLETVISRCTELSLGTEDGQGGKKGAKAAEIAVGIADALCKGDSYDVMLSTAPMVRNRELMKQTAQALTVILRDAMAADTGAAFLSGADRQALALAARYPEKQLLRMKAAMDKIAEYAEHNANENLLISNFSLLLTEGIKE